MDEYLGQTIPSPRESSKAKEAPKEKIVVHHITEIGHKTQIGMLLMGLVLGAGLPAIIFTSSFLTSMNFDTNILDVLTIGLAITTFIEAGILFIIYQYSWQHVREVLKATLWYKSYCMAGILQPDGRLSLKAADVGDELPDQWLIPRGKIWDEKRLEEGTQLNGPDRLDYAIFTAEGATSINMSEKATSELFGTSAYITKIGDLKKSEGYLEALNDMKRTPLEQFVRENAVFIIALLVMVCIGVYVMYDKIVTGPAGWQAANMCEQSKSQITAACSRYINVFNLNQTTATTLAQSNTGGRVG
jgi:hypothetical protein